MYIYNYSAVNQILNVSLTIYTVYVRREDYAVQARIASFYWTYNSVLNKNWLNRPKYESNRPARGVRKILKT